MELIILSPLLVIFGLMAMRLKTVKRLIVQKFKAKPKRKKLPKRRKAA